MKAILASILFISICSTVEAQSNYKESSNSFARYTQSGDIKQLESAKKLIDDAYKTKRDSSSSRNNVLRALVYSSLAYADSTRKIKSDKDPIDVTLAAIKRIKDNDKETFDNELNYVKQNLIAAYIYKANSAIKSKDYNKAYDNFELVYNLGNHSEDVVNNLASLAAQAGKTDQGIQYYTKLIKESEAVASNYLALAELYKVKKDKQLYLNTLQEARNKFGDNKQILFLLIQAYTDNKSYAAATPLLSDAIKYDAENTELLYLAGYVNENLGDIETAKKYYLETVKLDDNNYDANLALGLIYLSNFLKDKDHLEAQYEAQNYLLKANSIKPYAVNTLKGLALFYEAADDAEQLDRVNILLNQLSNN